MKVLLIFRKGMKTKEYHIDTTKGGTWVCNDVKLWFTTRKGCEYCFLLAGVDYFMVVDEAQT